MFAKILRSLSLIAFASAALSLIAAVPLVAQTAAPSLVTNRVTQPIDENSRVTLKGTVHPLPKAASDRGAAPDSMPLDRIQVVLKRSDAQESALKQLISDLHTPGTASYHKWLTPDQFGKQFGPSDQDIATLEAWLQSKGFSVTKVNPGKQTLEISGNVAQFRGAFHSQINKYVVNGETHYANATDPQIPAALAPVLGGFASLNNFRIKNDARVLGKATYDPKTGKTTPQWTTSSTPYPNFVLSPGDFGVQYDLPNASLNSSYSGTTYDGTGQTIAIVNDSNINIYLVNQFRSLFGLSANPPQVIIDGNDPGIDGINNPDGPSGDSIEAYLDVEWSGAVAPNATIDFVIAADTALSNGLILAAEHAVYGNIAPVLSLSFGACEQSLGSSNQYINNLWEQAAAQGITVLVSAGDNGSAGCDNSNNDYAVEGQQVSGFASTPYNVAVGGTDFYYSDWNQGSTAIDTQLGTYWNTTTSNNKPKVSILGVIPEQPWNESQYGFNIYDFYADSGNNDTTIAGGSGGASNCATGTYDSNGNTVTCTAGYPKPSWQTGTGVPADKVRDLPDVSLFASSGANASFYPECWQDGDCQPVSSGGTVQITGVGGTSASAPAFAGIMALINQKYGRQGQAGFVLYPLATQFPAAFHDVGIGTNSVPCSYSPSSPDCISVTSPITIGSVTEGQIGTGTTPEYNATTGYDLASGLGSVDASVLVTDWNKVTFTSTSTTLTPSQTSFTHGTSITVSGSVTPTSGTATGSVALMTDSTEPVQQGQGFPEVFNGTSGTFALTSGSYSGSVNYLPGGTYNIWGQYSGDGTNAASTSQKTSITVSPEASGIYFNLFSPAGTTTSHSIASGASIDYGTQLLLSAQVAPSSQLTALENCFTSTSACPVFGIPTGTVVFADNSSTINTAVINAEGDAEYNAPFALGSHSVTASYNGDNSYNKSTASAVTFTVVQDTPAIGLSASNQVSQTQFANGQSTVLNIEVLNGAAYTYATSTSVYPVPISYPTGTVTVTGLPGTSSTTVTLSAATDPAYQGREGIATVTVPTTSTSGNYTVNVSYSGDSNYKATSASFPITFGSIGGLATTTTATMTGSISPSTNITVSGTVTGQSGKGAPSNYNGGIAVVSSGYLVTYISVVPGSGDSSTFSATLNSQSLFQGANFVTLQYQGDQTYNISATTLNNGSAISNPLSDFSMVPDTTIVPVTPGSSGTTTINLSSVNGFSGAVSFSCATSTVTCSVTSSATLSSGSTTPLALTISAGSSAAIGSYNVLVTGMDSTGKFIHTLTIRAAVTGTAATPSFSLSANPTTLSLTAGATTGNTSTITVTPANGFTGSVALTYTVSGPSGATSSPTVTFSTSPVDITSTAAGTSVATIATTSTTTAGSYTITVTGTSGSTTENTTVTLTVTSAATPTFALSANPSSGTISAGSSATTTISVTPSNGFTGNVALTCSVSGSGTGVTCSLSPTTADVTGTTAVTSTLTIATSSNSAALSRPLNKFFAIGGGATLALLFFFGIPARRRSWRAILGMLVFAAIVGIGIGCGGGSNNNNNNSTSYTVTVTGTSGSLTETTTVNVTVN